MAGTGGIAGCSFGLRRSGAFDSTAPTRPREQPTQKDSGARPWRGADDRGGPRT